VNPILAQLPSGSRIAVIRLRSLGDCVLTTPALALLKSHRPDLQIAIVVEDRFAGIFEGNPDVDQILPPRASAISAWRPNVALNLHGGTRSMWLTLASRARVRAGFEHHAYGALYSAKIPRAQEILSEERPVHTAEHIASAIFWMGVPRTDIPRARLYAAKETSGKSYAVLHPFASKPDKTWPAERFLAVADYLQGAGLETRFLAGPADDAQPFAAYPIYRNEPLQKVQTLLSGAQLFIGNDSGPAHIAAAFGVPSIVLFGPSDPVTWAPWRTEAQVLTAESMDRIPAENVIAAVDVLRAKCIQLRP
jgi:heptosyltransferase III